MLLVGNQYGDSLALAEGVRHRPEWDRREPSADPCSGGEGAAATKAKGLSDEECDRRSERAKQLNLGRFLTPGYHGPRWTAEELALLGLMADDELAARIGKTVQGVRLKRTRLGIPSAHDRRKRENRA